MSRHRLSLSLRIRLTFLALGVAAVAVTGALAFRLAEEALEKATYERLTGIRETKKRQVEAYLAGAVAVAQAVGRDESAADAVLGLRAAWPPGGSEYGEVRALYDEGLRGLAEAYGFEDLLLLSGQDGLVVYSAHGSELLGRSIGEMSLAGSPLETAFRDVVGGGESARLADYAVYPEIGAVAAFATAPVIDAGEVRGLVAARLSIDTIDEVMTGGRRWRDEGLGETGETYLVGRDGLMRSDSRFLIESPADYLRQLAEAGVPEERIARIRSHGTTVLTQRLDTEAVRAALAGESAAGQIADYRGVPVLSSFGPVQIQDLEWAVVAEIDAAEAFAPARRLRNQVAGLGLAVACVVLALGYVVAKRTTEPLRALTRSVERLGLDAWRDEGRLAAYEKADDEVARLALQFDQVSRRLRETTVSRDYLDGLLASMLNAVFTIGPVVGEGAGPAPMSVRSANPAACRLLDYRESELIGLPLRDVLGSAADEPGWLEPLRRDGRLQAVEKTLRSRDGRMIPVLFTAALLEPRGPAREGEAVCVAQDIVDRKAAEQQLQALASRLLVVQEEERSRLARELHDDVTQRLGALAIDLGKLVRREDIPDASADRIRDLREQTIRLAHDVQGLSRRLHPSILDDLGLSSALRAATQALRERLGVATSFAAESLPEEVSGEAAVALYRVAQECFQNVARHAGASEVNVELSVLDEVVRLRIEDNGAGFDPEQARRHGGLGLASMSERMRLTGGTLEIRSTPGAGTIVTAELPYRRPAQQGTTT
ncbi:MAG: HAMP domain-containing protein [Acidobacteria bacterium]|nr:HAMP domain-containing protein [Acidobacteriota bacterium]